MKPTRLLKKKAKSKMKGSYRALSFHPAFKRAASPRGSPHGLFAYPLSAMQLSLLQNGQPAYILPITHELESMPMGLTGDCRPILPN
jgi:hypothetical protein